MKNFLSRFKTLPLKTRQLLSLGLILALFVALPLFIWAITTQRFELRKRAQELVPTPTPTTCPPEGGGPPAPCPAPPAGCNYIGGNTCNCGQLVCPQGVPRPTEEISPPSPPIASPSNVCVGQPDGTSCTGGGCPVPLVGPGGRPIPCTRPVWLGTCQNQVCTPPTSVSSCPSGDKGNLNCDQSDLINATDLAILLSKWRTGPCPYPFGIQGGFSSPDLNNDCSVNATDLSILLSNWKPD